jgi:AraC-like DNA-binding protein
MTVPCYSALFLRPFAKVLSTYERFDVRMLEELNAFDSAGRIPIKVAHELAVRHRAAVDDPDLGLKAALATPPGGAGALEYAMNSAPTLRDSLDVGARFARLYCDALRVLVEVDGARVHVRLHSDVPAPRPIADYAMAMWYLRHTRTALGDGGRLACYFGHSAPPSTLEYDNVFGSSTLNFGAPCYGFAFDREYLDAPLPASEPALHVVLCEYASRALGQLHDRASVVDRVRQIARRELSNGNATLAAAASALDISNRTLSRRLEKEQTTFRALLDETRRELALTYLGDLRVSVLEASSRLGFAHVGAFYRAFKRWTGEAPAAYMRNHRTASTRSGVAIP